jgi:anti-sigma factor RsiW
MTDEASREVLSRSLDGDLDSDEERELAARLEAEPALRAELEAMRRVRRSVAAFASSERVPPELDTLVDPLLRGKPTPVVVRPWARWLATAAAVILGVTVIIEVNRRTPGPNIESIARASKEGRASCGP